MGRCEICERSSHEIQLVMCWGSDNDLLYFCREHYVQHVKEAHHGYPLPGCMSLEDAASKR